LAYRPKPLDTSSVAIPESLFALMETLSANTHDLWARRRMGEGWTFGRQRDDGLRKHPNLVPYDDLAQEDRDYDRMLVCEVIKAILKLGYEIRRRRRRNGPKPGHGVARTAGTARRRRA
jgi:ryanodine receptor 2